MAVRTALPGPPSCRAPPKSFTQGDPVNLQFTDKEIEAQRAENLARVLEPVTSRIGFKPTPMLGGRHAVPAHSQASTRTSLSQATMQAAFPPRFGLMEADFPSPPGPCAAPALLYAGDL